jgi:methyl-accepting chemotaxis protein
MNNKQTLKSFVLKSIIAAISAIMITCVAVGIFSVREIIANHTELAENTLVSSALAVSEIVDGDIIKDFRPGDENTEFYIRYLESFWVIKRKMDLAYVYMLRRAERGEYYFLFDTDPDEDSPIGNYYDIDFDDTEDIESAFAGNIVVSDTYTDDWGTFMSGYAPIYDSAGNIIAIAGTDYEMSRFDEELSGIILSYILICAVTLLVIIVIFAVIISISYNRIKTRFAFVITRLQDFAKNISVSTNIFNNQSAALSNSSAESAGAIAGVVDVAENTSVIIKATGFDMQNAKNYFSEASNELSHGTMNMTRLAESIKDIEESEAEIAGVTEAINSIAKKTKILALNAEVEAARVGEAGKSFVEVASEVATLALSVEEAAKSTKTIIERNKEYTAKAVKDTQNVQEIILSINKKLDNLTCIVTEVS